MIYDKLEPELKKKWTDALRSGEYGQADGYLYDEELSLAQGKPHCCCLGIIENICGTPFSEMGRAQTPDDLKDNMKSPAFLSGKGPGLELGTPFKEFPAVWVLTNMNDGNPDKGVKKHSFEEIAEWIDKNL